MFLSLFKKKLKDEDYVHVVATRFNLDCSDSFKNIPPAQYKNPEWLQKRFELFEKYCLPSMEKQTDKNFVWLFAFHKDTPEPFRTMVENYEKKYNYIKIYWGTDVEEYIKNIDSIVKENVSGKKYLVTTRLDNDDGFAVDYIENIHKNLYETKNGYFIDFIYGYIYDAKEKLPHYQKFRRNPFSTRVEKWDSAKTIYVVQHDRLDEAGSVFRIKNKNNPMWLQVIHGGNVLNELDGTVPDDLSDFKSRFVVPED